MSRLWLMGFKQSSTIRMRLHVRAVLMTCARPPQLGVHQHDPPHATKDVR